MFTKLFKFLLSQKKEVYVFVLLLLLAYFFRFYNTPLRYSVGDDPSRDALVALEGAKTLQLPLTGPFSSLGPFTFGPWYYYFLILFTLFIPYDFAPWMYVASASMLTVYIMYRIGVILEGKRFGMVIALFTAISPPMISAGALLINPSLVPFYASLSILLFLQLSKKNLSLWWSFFFGIILGLGINHHYSMVGLLILPVLLLLYKPKKYLYFLITSVGIAVTFIPLLFFDLNNHWFTARNMFFYYTEGKKAIYVANRWLFYLRDFWPSFWAYTLGIPYAVAAGIIILQPLLLGWLGLKKKLSVSMILLLLAFGANFILLRYYWGERGYGYLQFLSPFILIFTSFLLLQIYKFNKYIGYSILTLFVLCILPLSAREFSTSDLTFKTQAKTIMHTYPNQQIAIYRCKGFDKVRSQAVVFLLAREDKLADTGKKIAFYDSQCNLPKNKLVPNETLEASVAAKLLEPLYPYSKDAGTIDLSAASEAAILEANWNPITPRIVFNSTVRWWFNEQP